MGFKDLPGGQNAKSKKGASEFAGEMSPKVKESPTNK